MDLWNRKESWDKEVGFGLEECKKIVFEDNVFPAGENYVVILIEVIGLYTICKCPIVWTLWWRIYGPIYKIVEWDLSSYQKHDRAARIRAMMDYW
jgi:hypothetical protein